MAESPLVNPYEHDTPAYWAWQQGWLACYEARKIDEQMGWDTKLDDLYGEWCKGHMAGVREGFEEAVQVIKDYEVNL